MKILGITVFSILVVLIQTLIIYALWDDTFVKFFGIQDVTFEDAFWISTITSVMFKSCGSSLSESWWDS